MDQSKSYKRTAILVEKSLQLKFMGFVLFLFLISGFAVWWEAYHSMGNFIALGFGDDQVKTIVAQFNKVLLIKMGVELVLIVFISMMFSHYIAGPLYRLQETMRMVRDGDFSVRVKFRKLDELKKLGETFNEMMDSLQKKRG